MAFKREDDQANSFNFDCPRDMLPINDFSKINQGSSLLAEANKTSLQFY